MTWPTAVRNNWFVIARSDRIDRKPQSVSLFGSRLVLARLHDGSALALEDRCPHRHAPLSAGRVTQAGIQCPYHGWTFGADGACTLMPGLAARCDNTPRVAHFPTLERDGLVWVFCGASQPPPLPQLVRDTDPQRRRFLWQMQWQAPIVECLENFLDALHTHYVHAGLVRQSSERQPIDATLTTHAEGFNVDYRGSTQQSGLLYRMFESQRTSERALFASPGTAQIEYCYRDGSIVRITLYFAPATSTSTHVFTTLHVSGRWAPAWAVRMFVWPFLRRVARQDAHMLHLQTDNRAHFGVTRYASTPADLVRPYLDRIWSPNAAAAELPVTREVSLLI